MTDLLNLFKEKADAFLATINQKGGVRATIEGLRRQMAEADRRRAMGRVKSELRRLDRQINEMITAVGVQAVALQEAGQLTSPELQPLCQHIVDLKAALSQQQAELAKLEAAASAASSAGPTAASAAGGVTTCAHCGRSVPAGGTFCPYCGAAVAPQAASASSAASPGSQAAGPGGAATPSDPDTASSPPPTRTVKPQPASAQPICAHCGAPLKPGARFCSKCGRAV